MCGIKATSNPDSVDRGDGKADTIHGDRALLDHVTQVPVAHVYTESCPVSFGHDADNLPVGVDMTLDDVAVEASIGAHGSFQVDLIARKGGAQCWSAGESR